MTWLILLIAYLLGSMPFGYIMSRLMTGSDIRKAGSGNIGATNVLRVIGWKAALPVFLLDMLKGVAAVLIARALSDSAAIYLAAGFMVMIGHSFPIFLGFRGGKAAATAIGVLAVVSLPVLAALAGWASLVLILTRYVSLASILGSLSLPLLFLFFNYDLPYIIFGLATAILITARHQQNIRRLLQGREPRLGQKT
jgi:acyl phosphate:glycerol-3-phosphate acyltransferase